MKRFLGCMVVVVSIALCASAGAEPIKAAVIRSTGTMFLGMTIWPELNSGWSQFGDKPVNIDYSSLGGYGWGLSDIEATEADVLILSNPGFLTYTAEEIAAVKGYVEAGHGLIITYGKFRSEDKALAPLVGLSSSIYLGTGTATNPFWLTPTAPEHVLFEGVDSPYVSGVPYATTLWGSPPWAVTTGTVLATLQNDVVTPRPGIVANQGENYRGLYFSYYIEDRSGGANQQDMQVFYNGLLWAAAPEPGTALLLLGAIPFVMRRRGRDK